MIKSTMAAAIALCSIVVFMALSPVSASHESFAGSAGYLPEQITNQAKEVLPAIDEYGDTGLSKSFPKEPVELLFDATPEMYS